MMLMMIDVYESPSASLCIFEDVIITASRTYESIVETDTRGGIHQPDGSARRGRVSSHSSEVHSCSAFADICKLQRPLIRSILSWNKVEVDVGSRPVASLVNTREG